jgi:hypothetical protein
MTLEKTAEKDFARNLIALGVENHNDLSFTLKFNTSEVINSVLNIDSATEGLINYIIRNMSFEEADLFPEGSATRLKLKKWLREVISSSPAGMRSITSVGTAFRDFSFLQPEAAATYTKPVTESFITDNYSVRMILLFSRRLGKLEVMFVVYEMVPVLEKSVRTRKAITASVTPIKEGREKIYELIDRLVAMQSQLEKIINHGLDHDAEHEAQVLAQECANIQNVLEKSTTLVSVTSRDQVLKAAEKPVDSLAETITQLEDTTFTDDLVKELGRISSYLGMKRQTINLHHGKESTEES